MKGFGRLLLSLAIAGVLCWLLLRWSGTSAHDVLAASARLAPGTFLLALVVQAGIYVLRALRFCHMLEPAQRPPLARMLPISAAHSLAAYVLPAKTGEATLVVYLKALCGLSGAQGLAVLLVSRILDLAAVAGSLSLACLVLAWSGDFPELAWLGRLGALLLLLTFVFSWLSLKGHLLLGLATRLSRAAGLERTLLGQRLVALAERIEVALREVGERRFWQGALLSLPVWLLVYLFYAVLARGLGLASLDFPRAIFGSSLAVLANLLPINGFAGFGTQDLGWVVGFGALGVERDLATESALAFHFIYLGNIAVFGLLGQVVIGLWKRSPAREKNEA